LLNGVFWRALQIYAYYLIVSLTTILLITVSRDIIAIPDNHQDYIALTEDPLAAIQSAFFLVSPPDLPGVLVLYLELTLFFIPMFILIAAWNSAVALFVSGSLWLLAQIYPDLLAGLPIHSFFNPMAWQFILLHRDVRRHLVQFRRNITGDFPQTPVGAIGMRRRGNWTSL